MSLAGSTFFVMGATLASTILGFGREVINAKFYGTQWEMDTFLAAATIPTILFGVFNGALVSALVPTFTEYITHGREDEAWGLGSTIVNTLAIVLTLGAIVGYVAAPWYVPIIAHGFPAPQMGVAIHMTRTLMPSIVAVSLSGVFSAMLNAYHRFRSAALTGIAVNVVTIGCVVALNAKFGIFALVFGTFWGLVAQMLVQLPAFLAIGKYRPVIDLHHPGLAKMWTLLGPIVLGQRCRPDGALLRPLFCFHSSARLYRWNQLRHEARQLPTTDFCGGDRNSYFPATCSAIRSRK